MSVSTPTSHQQPPHTGQLPQPTWDTLTAPRFQTLKFLGKGGQGFVQLAYDNLHKQRVAIKYIDRGWSRGFHKYVLRETLNHQQLSLCKHPHIVEFHEVFLTPSYLAVVMEYVNGTNLQHYLEAAGGKLPEDVARFIFQQLVIAVDFCHKKGKVNRDIKLANILLQEGHLPLVKLCDFGFSKDKFDDSEPQTQIGTALFTAPEIFTNVPGQVYDAEAADVWSCGVVLFVMLFGCHPFLSVEDTQHRKHAQVMKLIENAVRGNVQVPLGAEELYPQALDLVRHILVSAPSQRSKLPAIMAHPWFQEKLPPGAVLLNAAYLAMEHPVDELRQTPEEVHTILTAALSTSGQDEKSDCNSTAPSVMADASTVSGQQQQFQQQQLLKFQQQQLLQQQQPSGLMQAPSVSHQGSCMAGASTNPLGSQQGLLHHHLQSPASMKLQPPSPGLPAQMHLQAPAHVQMPQVHPQPSRLAQQLQTQIHHHQQHLHQQPSIHSLGVLQQQQQLQQPSALHVMALEMSGQQHQQQQHSGSAPNSSSSHAAVAVGPGPSAQPGCMAAMPHLVAQTSISTEPNPVAMYHPKMSPAMPNPLVQQPDAPSSSPMLASWRWAPGGSGARGFG
ncbi:hypothetical protein PLESTB_001078300 [Pleodorina starrii]|uniref:Protein kinase domain-containing protein n=1 Tax=Pleodorina starrii TaxID=330485 RepID=A0A9W6BQ49_9CHLO|nr:hypothetical protein PLESTB_001078300 [Pleodorina starrii]GLC74922.1 hypothetical protein PLESTF_001573400 [Pleodorina starrii]